jgi:hypothetical protein
MMENMETQCYPNIPVEAKNIAHSKRKIQFKEH